MATSNEGAIPPRRPWCRLHFSTWLILALATLAAATIVLPGEVGRYPERQSWVSVSRHTEFNSSYGDNAIVHGWPLTYLWRTPVGWSGFPDYSPASTPWKLADSVRDFRLLALIADVAVLLALLADFTALVEWRRRQRPRAIQFRLRSVLGLLTVTAILLGWWAHERAVYREIVVRQSRLETGGVQFVPRFPLWLRAIVGDARLSLGGLNRPVEGSEVAWDLKREDELRYIVEQFPHDMAIEANVDSKGENGPALASIERLERLECSSGWGSLKRFLAGFRNHPHLRELKIVGGIDGADMATIATIPHLESLAIEPEGYGITPEALAELKNCGRLQTLEIDGLTLTANRLDGLATATQLRRLKLRKVGFAGCGPAPLCRIHGLAELDLSESDVGDKNAVQLCEFESLRCLNLASTAITSAGIKRLLDRSSGPLASNLEQVCFDARLVDDDVIEALRKLPRLYFITLSWVNNAAYSGATDEPNYGPTILKVRRALPDRDIVDLQLFTGSIF